jgi:hypothetical protein
MGRHLMTATGAPVAAILEGGYNPEGISMAADNVVRALLGWQASARASSSDPVPAPQLLPSTSWSADVMSGDTYLDALAPELRSDNLRHGHAFNVLSDERGVLGSPMRAKHAFASRPEAVLDAVRRRLNALPAWQRLAADMGVQRVFRELPIDLSDEAEALDLLLETTAVKDFDQGSLPQRAFAAPVLKILPPPPHQRNTRSRSGK